ncbi:MAG: DNA-3-methyladenine glycosylase family protein [Gammaproteobacteria bacterium]
MTDSELTHTRRFRLSAPYDSAGVLAYLSTRAIPGVETVGGRTYARTVSDAGAGGLVKLAVSDSAKSLALTTSAAGLARSRIVERRIRRLFDLRPCAHDAASQLERDRKLAPVLRRLPGLRVPGAWDGFELAVRAVLGQQVSVKGATTLAGRLVQAFGRPAGGAVYYFPTPERLASANISALGMPRARGRAINALAAAVHAGDVSFDRAKSTEALQADLVSLPGIGPWTAQYVAMRALHEPDAYPATDLGLLRAAERLGLPHTARALERHAERWRPFRAYAVMALWRSEAL